MCGLPARYVTHVYISEISFFTLKFLFLNRGKTYIAKKLSRYLNWIGINTKGNIYNKYDVTNRSIRSSWSIT